MSNYSELLKDPRWQRKRLEVLNRDNWTCQMCGSTEKTLHVHHQYYIKDFDPWDYCSTLLVTLCHECHKDEEYAKSQTDEYVEYLLMQPILRDDIHRLLSHVACALNETVGWGSPCQSYRDKMKEIIDFIDETYRLDRNKKEAQLNGEEIH